jgi:predicted MFS family arabinose efflux permease
VLERLTLSGRGPLSAIHFAGVGFGIVISAIAVSAMLASGVGWRNLWIGSGTIALLATIVAATLIPAAHSAAAPPQPGTLRVGPSGIGTMTVAYGLFGFGYVITTTFLIAIIRLTPAVHAFEPWAWLVVGIAAIPSVTIWVWLGKRIGIMNAFAVACLIEAVGVAASVEWMTITGICLSALLLGGTFLGVTALGLIAAPILSSGNSHQAIGRMTASFAIGQMAGPTLAGFLSEHLGDFRVASLIAAAALVVSAALAIRTSRIFARSQIVVARTSERSSAGGIAIIQPIRCAP